MSISLSKYLSKGQHLCHSLIGSMCSYMCQIYECDHALFPTARSVDHNEPTASQVEIDNAIHMNSMADLQVVDASAKEE